MEATKRFTAATFWLLLSSILVVAPMRAQSVGIDRTYSVNQTDFTTTAPKSVPYALQLNIRGTPEHSMANWGPAFYKPGSGGVPQSGTSSATNTGTLNFSATPNNYSDFQFFHLFATDAEMSAFYPAGQYGVKFAGSSPPSPTTFTAGLNLATASYPAAVPQVTAADNGARWVDGVLRIKASGITTLTLNVLPEYHNHTATHGAFMTAGLYSSHAVIAAASAGRYYVPALSLNDAELTQVAINRAWLQTGVVYTLELRYGILASPQASANLTAPGASTATTFQGLSTYYNDTLVRIMLDVDVPSWATDADNDGVLDIPAGFDLAGYLARNNDIAAEYGNDPFGAWLHFFTYGLFEGRTFDANFIVDEYLELNPDLKAAFGTDKQAALLHWFQYGHPIEDRMGRVPIGFNVDNYLARYPDLASSFGGITPKAVRNVTVWHHFLDYGASEGRSDGDFDVYSYLNTNPDVATAVHNDPKAATLHWYFYGRREGRRIPGGFDVQNYRALYPDIVVFLGDDLYGSWLHYRDTGVYEGRYYDDKFRVDEYLALNPDVAAAVNNDRRDAFLHWIYYGQFEGRQGRY